MSPDLLRTTQELANARLLAQKGKGKMGNVVEFIRKANPFEIPPIDASLSTLKRPREDPTDLILERKIADMEKSLKQGKDNHNKIMKEFEQIDQERAIKDKNYTRKIALTFGIPEPSVKDIIQACSD